MEKVKIIREMTGIVEGRAIFKYYVVFEDGEKLPVCSDEINLYNDFRWGILERFRNLTKEEREKELDSLERANLAERSIVLLDKKRIKEATEYVIDLIAKCLLNLNKANKEKDLSGWLSKEYKVILRLV